MSEKQIHAMLDQLFTQTRRQFGSLIILGLIFLNVIIQPCQLLNSLAHIAFSSILVIAESLRMFMSSGRKIRPNFGYNPYAFKTAEDFHAMKYVVFRK